MTQYVSIWNEKEQAVEHREGDGFEF